MWTDRALVEAIVCGEHDALTELFKRHSPAVSYQARRACRGQQADDVVQEVFLRLWREPCRFDPERGSLPSFLRIQARRRAIDSIRSERARHTREARDSEHSEVRGTASATATDLAVLDRHALAAALAALPHPERQAIVLAYFGGHTYREVARLLQQPEGTIKCRIRAGLARLQRHLTAGLEPAGRTPAFDGQRIVDVGDGVALSAVA